MNSKHCFGSNFFFTLFDIVGTLKKNWTIIYMSRKKIKQFILLEERKKKKKTFYSRNTKQGGLSDKDYEEN